MGRQPGSCAVCSRPLPPDSVDGLCPGCFRTRAVKLPADTLRPVATLPLVSVRITPPAGEPLPADPPGLELRALLGRGGMGAVYLGREVATDRLVAVKFLHAPGDPASVERFQTEVRALAALSHPNIVTVFATNFDHPVPYFTMEYAPGGTLARRVAERGPLAPREAAGLLAAVARAAHAAHGRGIVHRDLKPANILLQVESGQQTVGSEAPDGMIAPSTLPTAHCPLPTLTPKVSDFGLAKRIDQAEGGLTGAGILGTPGYLAPEQVAGSPVTARTDVYGLGATLYHALTGHAPVEADAPHELALLVLNAEPRHVRAHRPGVPLELEAIVHKCLEKEPAGRYASAAELADDLERFAAGEPVSARPLTRARRAWRAVARSRRRLARLAAVAAALVAVFALGAGVGDRPRSRQEPLHRMQEELKAGRAVALVGATGEPGWHRWVHGASGFAPAVDRDDACMFQSFDLTTLELCPDPMTDRYRVRAELCQADVKDRTPDGELPKGGGYRVGLYFGRQSAAGNDGWRAECCLAVLFTEVPNAPAARVTFGRLMVTESPAQRPTVSRAGSASTPFTQADTLPGPWRTVEVEVTPEGVKAWVEHPGGARVAFVDLPAERVDRLYRTRNDGLDRWFPNHGVTTPAWNPRSGLGVWSQGSSLAMRNVTVTPLK